MAKTNWQDPQTSEMRSTHISGLQEAVGKIEESIGMASIHETDIPLTEVFIAEDDRYRIFQAPAGKRNWLLSPTPVIKRNGEIINSGFTIDYGGGAIILDVNDTVVNVYTAEASYIITHPDMPLPVKDLKNNKKYKLGLQLSPDGQPQLIFEEV